MITGNLNVSPDARVCKIIFKGPKYRFPSNIDFPKCRKLQPSLSERVIVDGHGCHTALHIDVRAKENQDRVPTLYLLPKLHKTPIKQVLLLILVIVRQQNFLNTSRLTAVKKHVIKYCEKVYERSGKTLFWSIKNSGEIFDKLKARDFNATSLSTYAFSTPYTT